MYRPTAEAILSHHKKLMKWDQPFMFQMADGIIDLSPTIRKAAHIPLDARNQPAHYPNGAYIGVMDAGVGQRWVFSHGGSPPIQNTSSNQMLGTPTVRSQNRLQNPLPPF